MTPADDFDAPLTPEEEARQAKREPAEDALLAAEAAAAQAGEAALGKCLACLGVLWDLGAIEYAARALERVREGAIEAVRQAEIGDEPDRRTSAKDEAQEALTERAAYAGAELNTPEAGEELRLLRAWAAAELAYTSGLKSNCERVRSLATKRQPVLDAIDLKPLRECVAQAWADLRAFRARTAP